MKINIVFIFNRVVYTNDSVLREKHSIHYEIFYEMNQFESVQTVQYLVNFKILFATSNAC